LPLPSALSILRSPWALYFSGSNWLASSFSMTSVPVQTTPALSLPVFQLSVQGNHKRRILIQVMHENMAPALVIDNIADSAKGLDDFFSGEGPAQTWTSISLMTDFGFDLI